MRPLHCGALAALCLTLLSTVAQAATYTDAEVNARAQALLEKLTLAEKITLMAGGSPFGTAPIPRLGIPALSLSDGPNGVRSNDDRAATVFPTGSALGATWDPEVVRAVGSAIGREARALGVEIMLGPNVNIQRSPLGGRSFESYSEDPLLSGTIGAAWVEGVQAEGVGTSVKHFVANEQELNRRTSSSNVDERTLREIYLRPFELIVHEAHPWTVMASYNRLNGTYMTESPLIRSVLFGEWGFSGLLMSDWGAVHSTVRAARAGLDLEMPGPPRMFGEHLAAAVRAGEVSPAVIDDAALRVLRTVVRSGVLDGPTPAAGPRPPGELLTARNHAVALAAAREAITLLKNDGGLLPLVPGQMHTLAVIGPNADVPLYQGGGSASVNPSLVSTPLETLRALAPGVQIRYVRGVDNDEVPPPIDPRLLSPGRHRRRAGLAYRYFANDGFRGRPVRQGTMTYFGETLLAGSLPRLSARFEGWLWPRVSGRHELRLSVIGTGRLYLDGREIIGPDIGTSVPLRTDFGPAGRLASVQLTAGRRYRLRVDYVSEGFHSLQLGLREPLESRTLQGAPTAQGAIEAAAAAARASDAAVVLIGSSRETETEGHDRTSMRLLGRQDELVEAILRANPRTVVVLQSGAPSALPWAARAPAIVEAWLDGEAGPQALAEVLLGKVNPSGKLPVSFPRRLADTPAYLYYSAGPDADYGEGVFVGYRYYDTRGIEPAFAFGEGLSYTTFAYRNLVVPARVTQGASFTVSVDVRNTGARTGAETVQLYVGDEATRVVVRPEKELKAFRKVRLAPGQTTTVSFQLTPQDLDYYDVHAHRWTDTPGAHRILVGSSSRDIRQSQAFELVAGPPGE